MINELFSAEVGAALAQYGSYLCYFAAGFGGAALAWSWFCEWTDYMEERMRFARENRQFLEEHEMDCAEPMVSDTVRLYSGEVKHG